MLPQKLPLRDRNIMLQISIEKPSESIDKYKFECDGIKRVSKVLDHLLISGVLPTKDATVLKSFGVTVIINVASGMCSNLFPDKFHYVAINIADSVDEDITEIMYPAFDAIERAREFHGVALVHCQQGISRSCAVVIGYLLWRDPLLHHSFDAALERVQAARSICKPNIGFELQLRQWCEALKDPSLTSLYTILLISPLSKSKSAFSARSSWHEEPSGLDSRAVEQVLIRPRRCHPIGEPAKLPPTAPYLDDSMVYLLRTTENTYIWEGGTVPASCLGQLLAAAASFARQLQTYEHAAWPPTMLRSGEENPEFLLALGTPARPGIARLVDIEGCSSVVGEKHIY